MVELLNCPFCGSEARAGNGFAPLESVTYAYCSNSDCQLHPVEVGFCVEEWNRRAIPPSPSTAPTVGAQAASKLAGTRMDTGFLGGAQPESGTAPTVEVDEPDHDAEMFAMLEADAAQEGAIHEMEGAMLWAAHQGWLCAQRASKPPAREAAERQSIDTQAFRNKLLRVLVAYDQGGDYDEARSDFIAHIDTWGGAAPATGNTEPEE